MCRSKMTTHRQFNESQGFTTGEGGTALAEPPAPTKGGLPPDDPTDKFLYGGGRPLISCLHATRGRPKKAVETMLHWRDKAVNPATIEYIMVVNESDPTHDELCRLSGYNDGAKHGFWDFVILRAMTEYSAPAWNVAASAANGRLLVQCQDDVFAPAKWDTSLLWRIEEIGLTLDDMAVVAVGDGYRKGNAANLMCTAICTAAYRDMEGHFLFPGYRSVFSDDDFSIRAYGHAADGEANLVVARDLVFRHEHHYHNKEVPDDATYQHENSPEAYSVGKRLFQERNARLIGRGLANW